jgi:hypothetical protein
MVTPRPYGRKLIVEQSMDVAFVIAGKLREGKSRVFNGMCE